MCSNDVHTYDKDTDKVSSVSSSCVGCHFCEIVCPTKAITIKRNPSEYKLNANWTTKAINDVVKQAKPVVCFLQEWVVTNRILFIGITYCSMLRKNQSIY